VNRPEGHARARRMPRLILASSSPRRRQLLSDLGLPFEVRESNVAEDEEASGATGLAQAVEVARRLAQCKAEAVARSLGPEAAGAIEGVGVDGAVAVGPLVIGADTVVVLDGHILGKPRDAAEARGMLRELAGRRHTVVTGVAVCDVASGRSLVAHEETRVFMRGLAADEIAAYVATGEPLDKAGAYAVQGLGALLVERIEGCYFNVVGLPLARLGSMLESFGVRVLGGE